MQSPRNGAMIRGALVAGIVLLSAGTPAPQARDLSAASVTDSSQLSQLSGTVVAGSAELLADGAVLIIQAVRTSGGFVILVLREPSRDASLSLRMSAGLAGDLSQAIGETVRVVAEASGHSLYRAGQLLAFIPNEVGRDLLHHAPLTPAAQP